MVECQANKIGFLLNELIQLLSQNDEPKWAVVLKNLFDKYNESKNKPEVARMIISVMQGGSGSLSDLVIQKDGKALMAENNKLDTLLDELYDECKKLQ